MAKKDLSQSNIRVRFAPSPTGELHIGGLRTALYNYLFAKRHNGTFILRIEDTDQERKVSGAVERLVKTLERFHLKPDEGLCISNGEIQEKGEYGPYIQSQRLSLYKDSVEVLLEKGHAYYCFCTSDRLESLRKIQQEKGVPTRYDGHCRSLAKDEVAIKLEKKEPFVVRLKVPHAGTLSFTDEIRGEVSFAYDTIDDQVLLKSDGFPTYHLANVVDDHEMKITHVIRGEEWLPSTPKHILLYSFFDWQTPSFAHLPILLDANRAKLSKRKGAKSAEQYLEMGVLPEALLNFILLLGWNPKTNEELFSRERMIELFSLEKVNMSGAIVNDQKLLWMNQRYIRAASVDFLTMYCFENGFLPKNWKPQLNKKTWSALLLLIKERVGFLSEIKDASVYYFKRPDYPRELLLNKKLTFDECLERLTELEKHLVKIPDWEKATVDDFRQMIEVELIQKRGFDRGSVLWPLRISLTGASFSPGAYELLPVFSKDEVLWRIKEAIRKLSKT